MDQPLLFQRARCPIFPTLASQRVLLHLLPTASTPPTW